MQICSTLRARLKCEPELETDHRTKENLFLNISNSERTCAKVSGVRERMRREKELAVYFVDWRLAWRRHWRLADRGGNADSTRLHANRANTHLVYALREKIDILETTELEGQLSLRDHF